MSTFPQATTAALAQSLSGAGIQSTYADTGNGTGVDVGAYPRAVVSGALALAGAAAIMTVQLLVKYAGQSTGIAVMSSQPNASSESVEHTFSSATDWCLQTDRHAGGVVYVQVKGDVDGTSGDTFTAYVVGVSP